MASGMKIEIMGRLRREPYSYIVAKSPKSLITPFFKPFVKASSNTKIMIPQKTPKAVIKVLKRLAFNASNISFQRSLFNITFYYSTLSASMGLICAALLAGINPAIPPKTISINVANIPVFKSTYGSRI